MKRRTFLHTGSYGLLGLGLPASAYSLTPQARSGVQHWLREFAQAVNARHRSLTLSCPAGLREQIESTNAFMAVRGYLSETAGAFFTPGQSHCFYPLVLRRAQAGLLDLLVPVFTTGPDGRWQPAKVLTGYQLEALARTAAALSNQDLPLSELLLPLRSTPGGTGGYETRLGQVQIITRIQEGQSHTAITVHTGRQLMYDTAFPSAHNLTTQVKTA